MNRLFASKKGSHFINWTEFWIYVGCAIVGILLLFTVSTSKVADTEQDIQVLRSQYIGLEGLHNLLATPMEPGADLADFVIEYYEYVISSSELSDEQEARRGFLREQIRNQTGVFIDAYIGEEDFVLLGIDYVLFENNEVAKKSSAITINVDSSASRFNSDLLQYVRYHGRPPIEVVLPLYTENIPAGRYYIKARMIP